MAKRTVTRSWEIDCEDDTCEECEKRSHRTCTLFDEFIQMYGLDFVRLEACKAAEQPSGKGDGRG